MNPFVTYLDGLHEEEHRIRMEDVLHWVESRFPALEPVVKWNTPMFMHHKTFIIGFSAAKNHMAVGLERVILEHFAEVIREKGYEPAKDIFRIKWDEDVDFTLLETIIRYTMNKKKDSPGFWL